jgi:hypothetical protein
MGLLETQQTHAPVENAEFSNTKPLQSGDAVCQVALKDVTSKKGKRYLILEGTIINVVATKSSKEVTIEPGEVISKIYDINSDEEGKADKPFGGTPNLFNDFHTAGITYEPANDLETLVANLTAAANEKLVYFSTWKGKKWATPDDGATFEEVAGEYVQKIKILSSNKVTPANSEVQLPF